MNLVFLIIQIKVAGDIRVERIFIVFAEFNLCEYHQHLILVQTGSITFLHAFIPICMHTFIHS